MYKQYILTPATVLHTFARWEDIVPLQLL